MFYKNNFLFNSIWKYFLTMLYIYIYIYIFFFFKIPTRFTRWNGNGKNTTLDVFMNSGGMNVNLDNCLSVPVFFFLTHLWWWWCRWRGESERGGSDTQPIRFLCRSNLRPQTSTCAEGVFILFSSEKEGRQADPVLIKQISSPRTCLIEL